MTHEVYFIKGFLGRWLLSVRFLIQVYPLRMILIRTRIDFAHSDSAYLVKPLNNRLIIF
jgi:hypothetical protein